MSTPDTTPDPAALDFRAQFTEARALQILRALDPLADASGVIAVEAASAESNGEPELAEHLRRLSAAVDQARQDRIDLIAARAWMRRAVYVLNTAAAARGVDPDSGSLRYISGECEICAADGMALDRAMEKEDAR